MMCKFKGWMDKGGHYDDEMKGWMQKVRHYDVQIKSQWIQIREGIMMCKLKGGYKSGIMMCKLKGQMHKGGHYDRGNERVDAKEGAL